MPWPGEDYGHPDQNPAIAAALASVPAVTLQSAEELEELDADLSAWQVAVSSTWWKTHNRLGVAAAELSRRRGATVEAIRNKAEELEGQLTNLRNQLWVANDPDLVDAAHDAAVAFANSVWSAFASPDEPNRPLADEGVDLVERNWMGVVNPENGRRPMYLELAISSLSLVPLGILKVFGICVAAVLTLLVVVWTALTVVWTTQEDFGTVIDYISAFARAFAAPAALTAAFSVWDKSRPGLAGP